MFVRVFSVDERNMPNGLYQFGLEGIAYFLDDDLALLTVCTTDFDFHQFVMFQ